MRNTLLARLAPDAPKPKPPSGSEPRFGDDMCEECSRAEVTACLHPVLHPYAMYVTPDDPLRDTVEKAERYYKGIEELLARKNEADAQAALKLLGVPASAHDMLDVLDA